MNAHRPSRKRSRGVEAIELALVLVPLLLMIFGITELGRAIYTYNAMDKSVRDAARHLSQHGPGDPVVQGEARCLAVYGKLNCSGTALAPKLTAANISVCDAIACPGSHASQPTGAGAVNLVSVTVHDYAFNSLVEWVVPSLGFNNISATMRAQL